jgi:cytochrome c oxidase subunit 2
MLDRTRERSRRRARRAAVAAAGVLAVVLAGCTDNGADHDQNSLEPKGDVAQKIMNLFVPFFWVAVVIGVLVLGAVLYVALRFRAREGHDDNPVQLHGSTPLEVGWTIVPALVLAVMAVPTVATIFDVAAKPEGDDVVNITVTGKQWWWEYEYTDDGFITANEMHIPVDRPVHLTLRSDNVIHSFWVPNLAGKRDLAPGRVHELTIEADEVGVYLGQCAEYCGLSHADMRLRVFAQSDADYETWVEQQREPASRRVEEFVTRAADDGGLIQQYGCTGCHSFAGVEGASEVRIAPNLTHFGDRTTFAGSIYESTFDELRQWVYDAPSRKSMQKGDAPGQMKVGMPSMRELGMTQEEADQIAHFLLCETASTPGAECEGALG